MPAYVIACVRSSTDQEALAEYRRRNTEAVANHGGRFLVRGGELEVLEGDLHPERVVLIEFADLDAARAWWTSEDYEPLKEIRRAASVTDIIAVAGAD